MDTLHIRKKILTELDIDPFVKKSLLTIKDTNEFLKTSLFLSPLEKFTDEDFEKVIVYLKDFSLENLSEDISTLKQWQFYEIELNTIPTNILEEYAVIGAFLLYEDSDFTISNFFYTTYEFDNYKDLLSEIKVAEDILSSYKYSIVYEVNDNSMKMKLYLFSC